MSQVTVIGHVEWVELLQGGHLPRAGELQQAERVPPRAGGSAVTAASMIAERGGDVRFVTAVGDDREGIEAVEQLRVLGIEVDFAIRCGPTRRVTVLLDRAGERTIITAGERWAPSVGDALDWERLPPPPAGYPAAAG